jgi:aldose 1-epimerase
MMPFTQSFFGSTSQGKDVHLYTLTNAHGFAASITNYGGRMVSLVVPDRAGALADVVLGYDQFEDYLSPNPFFGAIVGRCANRMANATFTLNGRTFALSTNDGEHHSHGGYVGFDKVVWKAQVSEISDGPQVSLQYVSKDGEEGYPGNLVVTITYTLTHDDALRIEYDAVPDADTVVSLTNHSYFNLVGASSATILDHELVINADHFTPINEQRVTTGELRCVRDTPMDFRRLTPIGQRIGVDDQQLQWGIGYDHNWALNNRQNVPTKAVELYEPHSGRVMEVWTTAPGVQFYAGNKIDKDNRLVVGKGGAVYKKWSGLCLETQHYPNAANHPNFPSPIVRAGEHYQQITLYKFSTR